MWPMMWGVLELYIQCTDSAKQKTEDLNYVHQTWKYGRQGLGLGFGRWEVWNSLMDTGGEKLALMFGLALEYCMFKTPISLTL